LVPDPFRDSEGRHPGRHSAVDGDLDEGLSYFIPRATVAPSTSNVQLEFLVSAQGGQNAEVVETAARHAQPVTAPDPAPAVLGEQILKIVRQWITVPGGPIDIPITQDFSPNFKALLVPFLRHGGTPFRHIAFEM